MRKQTKLVAALSATALLAIGASAVTFAAGWNNSTGEWQYLDNEGNAITDAWRKSGDYWFYLGSDGNMAKNEVVQHNEDYYFVNGDGAMVTNQWVSFDESTEDGNDKRWMYFGADGKAYKDKNSELRVADIKTINGKKYLFDQDGKMLYGWLGEQSELLAGDDAWTNAVFYYGGFDDGSAQHGWVQLTVNKDGEDKTYWFYLADNGKITKDTKKTINGATYYFGENGEMIEDWTQATKTSGGSFEAPKASHNDVVYVNGDGGARKNQWIWAVPAKDYDKDDYEDDSASWWYADNSGKLVKNKVKKIKGKVYAFNEIGQMISGLATSYDGRTDFGTKLGKTPYGDLEGKKFAAIDFGGNSVYYFSADDKDGSRKTGYQNVEFDDDTYQMYFKNSGAADNGYVNKIKKYLQNGIVLKADNDSSNYAFVIVDQNDLEKLGVSGAFAVDYFDGTTMIDENHPSAETYVLVNSSGVVQKNKKNIKDSNDYYYFTNDKGVVIYAGKNKLVTHKSSTPVSKTAKVGDTVYDFAD